MSWKPQSPPFKDFKKKVFINAAAVSAFIYQIGESEALRQPSKEVPLEEIQSKDFQAKIQFVKDCLLKYRQLTGYGRGITGVQAGIPERFSIIYTAETLLTIINPTITKRSSTLLSYPEICMSANPIIVPTTRPAWIECTYFDVKGQRQYWKTKDDTNAGKIMNRVLQHEIDHMEGVINIDLVQDARKLILESDPTFYENAHFEKVK